MMRLLRIIFFIFICSVQVIKAQDPMFTQFYASSLYLNPAFTGLTDKHRVSIDYRDQWPAIAHAFTTEAFSYDYNIRKYNSGVGVLFLHDKAGVAGLETSSAGLLYSYGTALSQNMGFRAGVQVSYTSMGIDVSKLTFSQQQYAPLASIKSNNTHYLDINTGALLYSNIFWVGLTAKHLNSPNQSVTANKDRLPPFFSLHGGAKIALNNEGPNSRYFSPAFNIMQQQNNTQLALGAYLSNSELILGMWYRGLPISKTKDSFMNNDALAFLAGYKIPKLHLRFGYSYDFTISRLNPLSGGSHELSLVYEVGIVHTKRFIAACPKF